MKKETLEKEYLENKLSMKKIAEKFNVSVSKVHRKIHEYKIPARKNYPEPNKGMELTEKQEKFVYAKLLGDGCITKNVHHQKYHFEFSQCEEQEEYARFCSNLLKDWGKFKIKERKRDPQIYKKWQFKECTFRSFNHPEFSRIYRHFYEYGIKIVNNDILSMIDDFGLAIWFQDDGHCDRGKAGYLNTLNFTLDENKLIVDWLWERFGIRSNVVKAGKSRSGKKFLYRIRLSSTTWKKFCNIVEPHMVNSLKYKIGKDTVRSS